MRMKFSLSGLAVGFTAIVLSACAGQQSANGPAVNSSISCESLTLGQHLQASVDALKAKPQCSRFVDDNGHHGPLYKAAGKMNPTAVGVDWSMGNDFAPRLVTWIAIYQQQLAFTDLPVPKPLSDMPASDLNFKEIDRNMDGGSLLIERATEPETNIDYACVATRKMSSKGTPLHIILCRSVKRGATDDEIRAQAQKILSEDISPIDIQI